MNHQNSLSVFSTKPILLFFLKTFGVWLQFLSGLIDTSSHRLCMEIRYFDFQNALRVIVDTFSHNLGQNVQLVEGLCSLCLSCCLFVVVVVFKRFFFQLCCSHSCSFFCDFPYLRKYILIYIKYYYFVLCNSVKQFGLFFLIRTTF